MDRVAFGALVKRKRGQKRLTQQTLAEDVFGDSSRKADISRIENAKVEPQEATIQKLCKVLGISEAEMAPIRSFRPAAQLDQIPTLSRDDLELLASRFGAETPHDQSDGQLREFLTSKAQEYRKLRGQIAELKGLSARIDNVRGTAEGALDNGDFDGAKSLLQDAREIIQDQIREPLEINATLMERQADIALLQGDAEQAYVLFKAAADSFAGIDPLDPARRKILRYFEILWKHGLRYGGDGLARAEALVRPILTDDLLSADGWLWAAGQNTLAAALQEQGIRTGGAEGVALLGQAVDAYRDALTVYTRAEHPVDWAMTQNNLANALVQQGIRTGGAEGAVLLGQAVDAYNAALTVYTRAEHPVDWAMTQNNLAIALRNQGTRTGGAAGAVLLGQAVEAYRAALTVYTRAEHPVDWAMTQNNLGGALEAQGTRTGGAEGAVLLGQAVEAYRDALTVRTRAEHPVHWAGTQNNLAVALQAQGIRTGGAEGAALLGQAIDAYRDALTVYTRAAHPVQWAMTQFNLAIAEQGIAQHDSCEDPEPQLRAALGHVEAALEVFDPVHMPYNHDKALALREWIQAALDGHGGSASGDAGGEA